jgi:type IV pilus assembly protein PilB
VTGTPPLLQLGRVLLRDGLVTEAQLADAIAEKEVSGQRLRDILLTRRLVSPRQLASAFAELYEVEAVSGDDLEADPAAVTLLPREIAVRSKALPLRYLEPDLMLMAVADPTNLYGLDDVRLALGIRLQLAVAPEDELERAIRAAYSQAEPGPASSEPDRPSRAPRPARGGAEAADGTPAVRFVDSVLAQAFRERASDVHFEPGDRELVVRIRVDGVTRELARASRSVHPAVASRLKIMGGLDIAERRLPQDGRVSIAFDGRQVDVRIAVLPTGHGEKIVMRLLQGADGRLGLEELGMDPETLAAFRHAVARPHGVVVACGPTGSGKTTTLYAALDHLNHVGRVLVTIEDPVEYHLDGVTQVQVHSRSGLTFARGLRTILRADPDVLLVGEIRDEETARIAMQAALTGHLVLTSLHTNSAAGSIARLVDMGVEPGLLASSISCVVSQRLARRLCTSCREPYEATPPELAELFPAGAPGPVVLHRPRGCPDCRGTGFRGRAGMYEVLDFDADLRRAVPAGADAIHARAVARGMTTLLADGYRLVLAGISSLAEVRRVAADRLE